LERLDHTQRIEYGWGMSLRHKLRDIPLVQNAPVAEQKHAKLPFDYVAVFAAKGNARTLFDPIQHIFIRLAHRERTVSCLARLFRPLFRFGNPIVHGNYRVPVNMVSSLQRTSS
jgi:hypothetical protein